MDGSSWTTCSDYAAIHAYIALCYYKLDYFDVSQEVLSSYLQHDPWSVTALNLKACNHFKLYNGKAAEAELKLLSEKASPYFRYAEDLINHNLVRMQMEVCQVIIVKGGFPIGCRCITASVTLGRRSSGGSIELDPLPLET